MDDIPLIPIVYVHKIVEMMREEDIDTDSILRESGVNPNLMMRPGAMLTLGQTHAVIHRYMGLSSLSLPALRFGQRLDLVTHGLLGHVYFWRGEFRELIVSMMGYLRVRFPLMLIELTEGTDHFSIRLSCRTESRDVEKFMLQAFIGSLHTLGSAVIRNIVIHCRHDLFSDVAAARHILKCEINNDHDSNEVRYYTAATRLQNMTAADSRPANDEAEPAGRDPYEEHGFVVRLRGQLLSQLRQNHGAEEIASAMGMSVRTLRRRLSDCGMSFNKLRLDVRMQVAIRYLTTTEISIERIADHVGYSDQASFTRAFKDWKGETPNQVRNFRLQDLRTGNLTADEPGEDISLPRPG